GIQHADLTIGDGQQPIVRDHYQRVDLLPQHGDAGFGLGRSALALETEGTGDHADRECAEGSGYVGHDRRSAGSCTTALPGSDEDHVGPLEDLFDLLAMILGRLTADIGVGSGAQATCEFAADVELDIGVTHQQRLRVRVDGDELDALEPLFDHSVDGIDTATADADDFARREVVLRCCNDEGPFGTHYAVPSLCAMP